MHRAANSMLDPLPYRVNHFGEKLHLDQNEKCVMFGITHVVAVDGYSRKIVGLITIPKKNPIVFLTTTKFSWSLGAGPCRPWNKICFNNICPEVFVPPKA